MCSAGLAVRQVLPPSVVTAAYCACLTDASFQPAFAPTKMRGPPTGDLRASLEPSPIG